MGTEVRSPSHRFWGGGKMNTELNRELSFARSPKLCPLPKLRYKTAITQTTGVFSRQNYHKFGDNIDYKLPYKPFHNAPCWRELCSIAYEIKAPIFLKHLPRRHSPSVKICTSQAGTGLTSTHSTKNPRGSWEKTSNAVPNISDDFATLRKNINTVCWSTTEGKLRATKQP